MRMRGKVGGEGKIRLARETNRCNILLVVLFDYSGYKGLWLLPIFLLFATISTVYKERH